MLLTWGSSWESAGGAELLLFVPPPGPNLAHPLDQTAPQDAQGGFTCLSTQNVDVSLRAWQDSIKVTPSPMTFLELQQILIKLLSLNLLSHYLNGTNTEEETGSAKDQALS